MQDATVPPEMPRRDDIRILFGKRLGQLRYERNWSQEELAHRAGLHRTYVSSAERGQRNVSLVNIGKLAHALDVEVADLFRGM